MATTITLHREVKLNGSWVATTTGDEEDYVRGLFGTNQIPTAFTSLAKAYDVLTAIRKLNPDCKVVLA